MRRFAAAAAVISVSTRSTRSSYCSSAAAQVSVFVLLYEVSSSAFGVSICTFVLVGLLSSGLDRDLRAPRTAPARQYLYSPGVSVCTFALTV